MKSPVPSPVLLRARIVLPVVCEPIEDGAILVDGNRILAMGAWKSLCSAYRAAAVDLGDVIVFPGLVNAHCHLDYTDMAGQITTTASFSDWIKALLPLKAHWSYSDFAASWLHGADMLLRHGVTTVGDIEAVPELLPEVRQATPLRICSFIEMTGVRSRRPPADIVRDAIERIDSLPPEANWAGLSPHAPYSTTPELLCLAAQIARERRWLIATHVAESREEFEMYQLAAGAMFEWLQPQRSRTDCGRGSPIKHLERCGLLGPNALAIHANYLAPRDADLLGLSGANVVHCPRSHAYFGHRAFPRKELVAAGVNICLGTDSLASVRVSGQEHVELDLLAEMRALALQEPGLPPEYLLRLGTLNGAKALGMTGKFGEISQGAFADLALVPFTGPIAEAPQAIVAHSDPVAGVMIDGRWAIAPPEGVGQRFAGATAAR